MNSKVLESSFLLIVQQLFRRLVGVISTVILARLLTPDDFGLVAIAMLTLWFAESLTASGTQLYVVQKETLSDSELNSSWTLDLLLKNCTFLLISLASVIYGTLQGNMEVSWVIISVCLLLVISSFKNPGVLFYRREQNYRKLVINGVWTKVVAISVSVPTAFILRNHWALVLSLISSNIVSLVMSYRISSYRPSLDLAHVSVQWNFSKWLIPQSLIGFLRSHLDTAIVSLHFPTADLGGYNTTKYFAFMPVTMLINPMTTPLHRELGKVQSLKGELKKQFDITSLVLGFIVAPLVSTLLIFSHEITLIILGDQWVAYSGLLGYFAFMSLSMAMLQQTTRLAMVKKFTRNIFYYELVSSSIILAVLFMVPKDDIFVLAIIKMSLELVLTAAFYSYIYLRTFDRFGIKNIIALCFPAFMISLMSYQFYFYIDQDIFDFLKIVYGGFFGVFGTLILFITYVLLFSSQYEKRFFHKIFSLAKGILK